MSRHVLTLLLLTLFSSGSARVSNGDHIDDLLRNDFFNFLEERYRIVANLHNETLLPLRYFQARISLIECGQGKYRSVAIEESQTILREEVCGTFRMHNFCRFNDDKPITVMKIINGTSILGVFVCALDSLKKPISTSEYVLTRMLIPLFAFSVVAFVIYNFRKMSKEKSEQSKLAPAIITIMDNSMDTVTLDSSRDDKPRKELARFDEDYDPSIGTLFTLDSGRDGKSLNALSRFDEDSDPSIGTVFTL